MLACSPGIFVTGGLSVAIVEGCYSNLTSFEPGFGLHSEYWLMRILHCIQSMLGGGAERQLAYLATEQNKRGWQVDVALLYNGPNYERLQRSGSTIHHLSCRGNHNPYLIFQIVRLIHSIKPDIVQTWLPQMDVIGGVAAKLKGIPWILCERSSAMAYAHTFKSRLRKKLGLRAQAIVANSGAGDAYWESCGSPLFQRHIIHNGLPLEEISEAPFFRRDSDARAPRQKMVLYAGRLISRKNIQNLILGIRKAALQVSLTAFLCGDGALKPLIRELVRDNGLEGMISLPGYVGDVWSRMKGADAFVSFSLCEGQPNAVLEAMACGCPLVLSDIPAHREIVSEEEALFVDPHSPDRISEALAYSLEAPAEAGRRAEMARSRIEKYSLVIMADRYEKAYLHVIGRHQAGKDRFLFTA